jgi:hypothetical protein
MFDLYHISQPSTYLNPRRKHKNRMSLDNNTKTKEEKINLVKEG